MREGGGGGNSKTGGIILGLLMARNIPRKRLVSETGIHESTPSRKINGIEDFQPEELLRIGIAIGKADTKQAA